MPPLIVVVDDDELVRMNLELVLNLEGYRVKSTASAAAALQVIDQVRPDLVLLDLAMPEMSGWELIGLLRQRERADYLPIIALTGEDVEKSEFRKAGFTAHLAKGEPLEKFLCTIRSAISIPSESPAVWLHSCNGSRCLVSPAVEPRQEQTLAVSQ